MERIDAKELSDFKLAVKDAEMAKQAAELTDKIVGLADQAIRMKYNIKPGDRVDIETGVITRKPEPKEPSENVVPLKPE